MCCLGALGGQARVEVGTGPGKSQLDELSLESRVGAFIRTGPLGPAWGGREALLYLADKKLRKFPTSRGDLGPEPTLRSWPLADLQVASPAGTPERQALGWALLCSITLPRA